MSNNNVEKENFNEGLGTNEPVNIKSNNNKNNKNNKPGLLNQLKSGVESVIGMNPSVTSDASDQVTKTYEEGRSKVMNGVSKVQNRGLNIIGQFGNVAKKGVKTVTNTATKAVSNARNTAKNQVGILKKIHSNATGTTEVIKAIQENGRKTRRRIRKHMDSLAEKVETSCGRARNNSITVGGKRKSRKGKAKAKGKNKGKNRMTKRKSKRHYRKRKTTKKSRS